MNAEDFQDQKRLLAMLRAIQHMDLENESMLQAFVDAKCILEEVLTCFFLFFLCFLSDGDPSQHVKNLSVEAGAAWFDHKWSQILQQVLKVLLYRMWLLKRKIVTLQQRNPMARRRPSLARSVIGQLFYPDSLYVCTCCCFS